MPREPIHLLQDILREARRLESFAAGHSREHFRRDWIGQHAVERALEIIGEALSKLDEGTRARMDGPTVPVRQAISMRNRLAHQSWTADPDVLWETITEHMAPLIAAVGALLPVSIEVPPDPAAGDGGQPPNERPEPH